MNFNIADLPAVREQLERDAAELLAAHAALAAGGAPGATPMKAVRATDLGEAEAAGSGIAPNPDRTHMSAPRVRIYVAPPRTAS